MDPDAWESPSGSGHRLLRKVGEVVRLRRQLLVLMFAVLGAGVVILPAVAGSETSPAITAENYASYRHRWSPATATVGSDGIVTLSNNTEVEHGVEWVSGPETPDCSSGVPVGNSPSASATKWSGTCTFSKPGTYIFYCTVHGPEMTGTITVNSDGTTTTTMSMGSTETLPSPSTTSTSVGSPGSGSQTTNGPTVSSPLDSPLAGRATAAVELAGIQRGRSVHGSIAVSQAGAGGRLEVELLASHASLASASHVQHVLVGRVVRSSLPAGMATFAVPLDVRAEHALHVRRRLTLTAEIVLTPVRGSAVRITRSVLLRR